MDDSHLSEDLGTSSEAAPDSDRLFDLSPQLIVVIDPDGRIIRFNSACTTTLAQNSEELAQGTLLTLAHPGERIVLTKLLLKLSQHNEQLTYTGRFQGRTGYLWLKWTFRPCPSQTRHYAFGQDITGEIKARSAAEQQIEFEKLARQLSTRLINPPNDDLDEVILDHLRIIGEYVDADRSYIALFSADQQFYSIQYEWYAPDISTVMADWQQAPTATVAWGVNQLLNLETVHIPTMAILPPAAAGLKAIMLDEGIRSMVVVPLIEAGAATGWVAYESLTEERVWRPETIELLRIVGEIYVNALQKRAAESLLQRHTNFQALIMRLSNEFINIPVGQIDVAIQQSLAAIVDFVGADRGFVGRFSSDLKYAQVVYECTAEGIASLAAGATPTDTSLYTWSMAKIRRLEVVHMTPTGMPPEAEPERQLIASLGNLSTITVPLSYDGKPIGYIGFDMVKQDRVWSQAEIGLLQVCGEIFVNGWQRQRAARELNEKNQLLANLAKEREVSALSNTLLSIVSHDLRNPLAAMRMTAETLRFEEKSSGRSVNSQRLGRIVAGIEQLTETLDNLSFVVQRRDGQLRFRPETADLAAFCRQLVAVLATTGNLDHPIEFALNGSSRLVPFDQTLLRHALNNLIVNALKYSPKGSPVTVTLTFAEEISIAVQDKGFGIAPAEQKRLFEAYYRGEQVGHIEGTGLGLRIVHDCVKLHNGRIELASTRGQGSTFIIILPLTYPDSE